MQNFIIFLTKTSIALRMHGRDCASTTIIVPFKLIGTSLMGLKLPFQFLDFLHDALKTHVTDFSLCR